MQGKKVQIKIESTKASNDSGHTTMALFANDSLCWFNFYSFFATTICKGKKGHVTGRAVLRWLNAFKRNRTSQNVSLSESNMVFCYCLRANVSLSIHAFAWRNKELFNDYPVRESPACIYPTARPPFLISSSIVTKLFTSSFIVL